MDIKSLMVGDWVYNKHHGKNIRLTPYDFFTHTHNGFGEQRLAPYATPTIGKDLEPIPLTPEILEKNGFKEDKYGQMILDEELGSSEIYIVLQEGDECYWWTVSNELIAKIRYVHELQHVFRLCKIEKEIEL